MSKKIKILHVDDEEDIRAVVKVILEKEGYEVVGVSNAKNAINQVGIDGYDLIILDIMMPDMSGWDLFTKISKIKPNYKIIFLSILDVSAEKIKELKAAGVKDYIKKPFDRVDFVARVKKALK